MPVYFNQKMSSGTLKATTYYRKQKETHASHTESSAFTKAAKADYAKVNKVKESDVEEGKFLSGQGVPSGTTKLI